MALEDLVLEFQPALQEIEITSDLIRKNGSIDKGAFAEKYVYQWLQETPKVQVLNQLSPAKNYSFEFDNQGRVKVYKNSEIEKFEFDGCVKYKGSFSFLEVKANKLNGYTEKIYDIVKFQNEIFGSDGGPLFIFLPMAGKNGSGELGLIKKNYGNRVEFVDTGLQNKKVANYFNRQGYKYY